MRSPATAIATEFLVAQNPHNRMTTTEMTTVSGHCYCGGVTFTVTLADTDPIEFSEYCHCSSCRRAHAAPLFQGVCLPQRCITVTAGKDRIRPFRKVGVEVERQFCGTCGTRLFNAFVASEIDGGDSNDQEQLCVFFPSTLSDEDQAALPDRLQPKTHNHEKECVLDMKLLQKLTS